MQVILKKDIPQVGRIGELVKVRDGYARNFLIPRSLAVPADPKNIRQLEHQKRIVDLHKKAVQKESEKIAAEMKGISVTIERRVNEAGKLFGSLSTSEIAHELEKKKLNLDKRDIEVETIKAEGTYSVKIRLPGDVYTTVQLTIKGIQEKAEKKAGAKGKAKRGKKAEDAGSEESAAAPQEEIDQTDSVE